MKNADEVRAEERDVHCPVCNAFLYNTRDLGDLDAINRNVERVKTATAFLVRCRACKALLCYPVEDRGRWLPAV